MPLSYASFTIASDCSSGTPGENIGHVPKPTFETRNPLLPKFLYRNPGVGVAPWRIVNAGFEPKLIERPLESVKKKPNKNFQSDYRRTIT